MIGLVEVLSNRWGCRTDDIEYGPEGGSLSNSPGTHGLENYSGLIQGINMHSDVSQSAETSPVMADFDFLNWMDHEFCTYAKNMYNNVPFDDPWQYPIGTSTTLTPVWKRNGNFASCETFNNPEYEIDGAVYYSSEDDFVTRVSDIDPYATMTYVLPAGGDFVWNYHIFAEDAALIGRFFKVFLNYGPMPYSKRPSNILIEVIVGPVIFALPAQPFK